MTLTINDQKGFKADNVQATASEKKSYEKPQQNERLSITSLNNRLGGNRVLTRHSTSETVAGFAESFKAIFNPSGGEKLVDIIAFDAQLQQVPVSAILIVSNAKANNVQHAAVYTLLLESSSARLQNKSFQTSQGTVEIPRTTIDVFDEYYVGKIEEAVRLTGLPEGTQIYSAGVNVIPSELTKDDVIQLRKLAFYAQESLVTTLQNAVGADVSFFSISDIDMRDTRFPVRVDFSTSSVETASGMVCRSDISVGLSGHIVNSSKHSHTQIEQSTELVNVNGYIDLTYIGASVDPYTKAPSLRQYQPSFVITRMDTGDVVTPEVLLLGFLSAAVLDENLSWANTFRPNMSTKSLDLRDIGAIGYDINLTGKANAKPERIDVKAESFDDVQLSELITTTMHEHLVYAMDIEEAGDLSYLQTAFLAAAEGDLESNQAIIDAATRLTCPEFEAIYNENCRERKLPNQVCFSTNLRIPLGYYEDGGVPHDVRELDLVAVLNLHKADPLFLREWSDVFDNHDIDPVIRTAKYLELIQRLLSSQFHHKGWAHRVTINPAFIDSLAQAASNAGLVISQANTNATFDKRPQRGNSNLVNYAVSNAGQSLFRSRGGDRVNNWQHGRSLRGGRNW